MNRRPLDPQECIHIPATKVACVFPQVTLVHR